MSENTLKSPINVGGPIDVGSPKMLSVVFNKGSDVIGSSPVAERDGRSPVLEQGGGHNHDSDPERIILVSTDADVQAQGDFDGLSPVNEFAYDPAA